MKRLLLAAPTALAIAAVLTTSGLSGQGRVDWPGVMTPEGGVPALGSYKVPKTPWGEPDLQGIYNANDLQGIQMQRQPAVGTRYRLNDDSQGARHAAGPERGQRQQRRVLAGTCRGVRGAVRRRRRRRLTAAHWLERARRVVGVLLVIDPPDGRIPALTPAAQAAATQRQEAQAARRKQLNGIEAEWTTDRSNYDRCISTGVLNSITPKIYNSGSRIVQGPGWLAFQNEMIHETRVIPTDGRRRVGGVRNWMGTSVGRWEGDVLVVESRNVNPDHPSTASRCRTRGCDRTVYARRRAHAGLPHDRQQPQGVHGGVDPAAAHPARRGYGYYDYGAARGTTRCPISSPARAPRRSGAPRRWPAARRFLSHRAGARRRARARWCPPRWPRRRAGDD